MTHLRTLTLCRSIALPAIIAVSASMLGGCRSALETSWPSGTDVYFQPVTLIADPSAPSDAIAESLSVVLGRITTSRDSIATVAARLTAEMSSLRAANALLQQKLASLTDIRLSPGSSVTVPGIAFRQNRTDILPSSEAALQKLYWALVIGSDLPVELRVYTDEKTRTITSQILSLGRAEAVRAWLTIKGIDQRRLTVSGMGPGTPPGPTSRRLEVIVPSLGNSQ